MSEALLEVFAVQAQACAAMDAPFSSTILSRAAEDLAGGGPVAGLLRPWAQQRAEQLVRDAVALRLLASLHHLVLTGASPDLAACYPPLASDPDRAWAIARTALQANTAQVAAFLTHEPQTNEVRRSACLLGGFLTIGQATGLPLRCFELGGSAGLNSLWDKYRYHINGQPWGPKDSPVVLPCQWEGKAPSLDTDLTVVERHVCDRRPVDLRQPSEVMRLLAYCWAEQRPRIARLQAAIAEAQSDKLRVDAQPASAWINRAKPQSGTATVVFNSVMWQYMAQAEQDAVRQVLQAQGAMATRDAPFFWLQMEFNETHRRHDLLLWDALERKSKLLAVAHPHGEWVRWL